MIVNKNRQVGASTWGTLFIVLSLIFMAVTAAKLWTPYFDDMAVKTAVRNIAESNAATGMGPNEIRATINKRLEVNNVKLTKDEILVKKEDGEVLIEIIYERRVPLYANVDAVLKFKHSATVQSKR